MTDRDCVFCQIIASGKCEMGYYAASFEPLHPVVPGHLLVVSLRHVPDALADVNVTARTMLEAVLAAKRKNLAPCNIMTSVGAEATQSVFHLHIHIVPRTPGDGLMLPWTGQQAMDAGVLADATPGAGDRR